LVCLNATKSRRRARRIDSKQVRRKKMGSDLHVTASVEPPPAQDSFCISFITGWISQTAKDGSLEDSDCIGGQTSDVRYPQGTKTSKPLPETFQFGQFG
jgi:hypothetical protein